MNIWIVNPFDSLPGESFRPGRYAFLANLLANKGHKVTWWTSNFFHMTKSIRCKSQEEITVSENLRIICLKTPKYRKNIDFRRIWNHIVYAREFFRNANRSSERPDVIVASVPPLSSAKAAISAARNLQAKCVVDVQDLWPEVFETFFLCKIKFFSKTLLYPLKKLADLIYTQADATIGVSETFVERADRGLKDKIGNSMVLPLGIDVELYKQYEGQLLNESNLFHKKKGDFWATYVGTIGETYDLKTILNTASILSSSHSNIKFFVAGEGPQLNKLKRIKDKNDINTVAFTGFIDFKVLIALLEQSDVGLNTYVSRATQTMPNKIFDYMVAGLPIINSLKGQVENLLKKENIGVQYEAGNPESLRNAILNLYNNPRLCTTMGGNAKKIVKERFDKNREYPKLEAFLERVVKSNKQAVVEDIGMGNVWRLKTYDEAKEVARLHINSIKEGFLSKLGEVFLTEFYHAISQSEDSFCLVIKNNRGIKAFIAGTTDISKFHREFIKRKGLRLMPILLKNIFRRGIAIGILEDIFYPRRISAHTNLPRAELIAITVDDNYQGKGYGSFLMNAFLKEMKDRNIDDLKVLVGKSNRRARRFYNKRGFVNKATVNIHKGIKSCILVKKITSADLPLVGVS